MIRTLLFAFLTFVAGPLDVRAAEFSDAQRTDLARVSAYLNSIESAQGRFVQIGPDGALDEGTFYLRKPGRVRFEYDDPNPNVVVSDGITIAVENSRLRTTDRYPLVESPLTLLLSVDIDLVSDERVVSISREPGALSFTVRQDQGLAQGEITLVFADTGGSLELRQWEVVDAQGLRTLVALTALNEGVEIPARLFIIQDLDPFSRRNN